MRREYSEPRLSTRLSTQVSTLVTRIRVGRSSEEREAFLLLYSYSDPGSRVSPELRGRGEPLVPPPVPTFVAELGHDTPQVSLDLPVEPTGFTLM